MDARKRPRDDAPDSDLSASASAACHPLASLSARDFSFSFLPAEAGAAPAISAAAADRPASLGVAASDREVLALRDYVDPRSQLRVRAGDLLRVEWAASSSHRLLARARPVLGEAERVLEGEVPPHCLQPLCTPADRADGSYDSGRGGEASALGSPATVLDSVWPPAWAPRHASASPLTLEPGLASLVWPLSPAAFLSTFYRRRALVVHASGIRTSSFRRDLGGTEVGELVRAASRCLVWMREAAGGGGARGEGGAAPTPRVSYLESPSPAFAAACFAAGHTLYFNPPEGFSARYVAPLAAALGLGAFGATADGGIGGDCEAFAVRGTSLSPWHWDAQDNFCVQLTGAKRWSLAASGVCDPVTNLHPSAANSRAAAFEARVHAACGLPPAALLPPGAAPAGAPQPSAPLATFTMRAGSVLYLPAGMWHRVEALGGDDGGGGREGVSLHVNISLSGGGRWSDFVLRRLAPVLWRQPAWRARLATGAREGEEAEDPERHPARLLARALLDSLRSTLAALTVDDLLPLALLEGTPLPPRAGGGAEAEAEAEAEAGGAPALRYAALLADMRGRAGGAEAGAAGRGAELGAAAAAATRALRATARTAWAPALEAVARAACARLAEEAADGEATCARLAEEAGDGKAACSAAAGSAAPSAGAGSAAPRAAAGMAPLSAAAGTAPHSAAPAPAPPLSTGSPTPRARVIRSLAVLVDGPQCVPAGSHYYTLNISAGVLGRSSGGFALDGSAGGPPDYAVALHAHALTWGVWDWLRGAAPAESTDLGALISRGMQAAAGGSGVGAACGYAEVAEGITRLLHLLAYTGALRIEAEGSGG